jgi:fucose 4-O-acetylase-like acetyltransferase
VHPSGVSNLLHNLNMIEHRRQDIEFLRIISALGIVVFHHTQNEYALSSLMIFVIISFFLAGSKKKEVTKDLMQSRFRRLMIPWFFWFLVYGLSNALHREPFIPRENGVLSGILAGPSIHLWYVPFLFGALLIFDVFKQHLSTKMIAIGAPFLAAAILLATPWWRNASIEIGPPLAQYVSVLPAALIGIYLSHLFTLSLRLNISLIAILIVSAGSATGFNGVGWTYLIALLLTSPLIFDVFSSRLTLDLSTISSCMFGVYLLHVKILGYTNKLIPAAGILIPITAFLVTTIIVYATRRMFPRVAHYWS